MITAQQFGAATATAQTSLRTASGTPTIQNVVTALGAILNSMVVMHADLSERIGDVDNRIGDLRKDLEQHIGLPPPP